MASPPREAHPASGITHVTNGGSIHTTGAASEGIYNGSAAVTMVNTASGVIATSGTGSAAMLDLSAAGGGTLTNHGRLTTSGDDATAWPPKPPATRSSTAARSRPGVQFVWSVREWRRGGAGNTTLTNNGSIDISGSNAHGIVSLDASPGLVTNTGSIVAHGPDGARRFFRADGHLRQRSRRADRERQGNAIDANSGGTFTNAGTISGAQRGHVDCRRRRD